MWRVATCLALMVVAPAAGLPPVLTRVAEVKGLTPQGATVSMPVRLQGVITVSLGSRSGAFLQDETGGVFVSPKKGQPAFLRAGDWVECTGWTAAGQYAPVVVPDRIEYLGRREIPPAVPITLDEFSAGRHDGEWVEARGVVRRLAQEPNARPELEIAVGRERLRIQIADLRGNAPAGLVDAKVRISGVASGYFNRDRQLLLPVLFAPDWSQVEITQPASPDPFATALRSTTSLFRYAPDERWGHRCRVRGTMTHHVPGQAIFLRDEDGPLYIEITGTIPLQLGDRVEAAGFPAVRQGAAYLQDAIYRVVGSAQAPPPIPTDPAAIAQGVIRPSELISIAGWLVESRRLPDKWVLTLRSDEQTFDVHVAIRVDSGAHHPPELGSRLRATGILWTEDVDPKSRHIGPTVFRVLSRSPADLAILERPSWWTRARLAQIVVTLLVVVAAAFGWIGMLRRRVEAQTSTIAEKVAREAVAEERARTACEIHDTLAQGFMGLGFQLEALAGELKDPPTPVRQHLGRAMKMLRHSHDEVRDSLKQLRGPARERKDLSVALREAVERGAANFSPANFRYIETGDPFPLLAVVEHNLLRIGQEAATNAAKHAVARHLEVELGYAAEEVRLRITDDGCGFEPSRQTASPGDHFGLQIMKERAQRIGGALEIRSRAGGGTEIRLTVPKTRAGRSHHNGRHP